MRAVDDIQESLRKEFAKAGITYAPKQSGSRKKKDHSSILELDKTAQYLASAEKRFLIQAIDNKSELFDEPYQKIFKKGIRASEVYLAWLIGNMADAERQKKSDGLAADENVKLLSVTSVYWIVFCTYKLLGRKLDFVAANIPLEKLQLNEFDNALRKYVRAAVDIFYDAAVDTYDRDAYGSFRSSLRSVKFLEKVDSKMNSRVLKATSGKGLPDLRNAAKSAKV